MDSPQREAESPVPISPPAPPDVIREAFPGFALPEAALHSIPLPKEFRQLLTSAVEENRVKSVLPKYFNGLLRKQGVVNKLALGALESVGHSLERLAGEIESRDQVLGRLVDHINAQNTHSNRQHVALAQFSAEISRVLHDVSAAIKEAEARGRDAEKQLAQSLESVEARRRRHDSAALSTLRVLDRQYTALLATIEGAGDVLRQRIDYVESRLEESLSITRNELRQTDDDLRKQLAAITASTKAIDVRLVEAVDAITHLVEALQGELQRAKSESESRVAAACEGSDRLGAEFQSHRKEADARDASVQRHFQRLEQQIQRLQTEQLERDAAAKAEIDSLNSEIQNLRAAIAAGEARALSANDDVAERLERTGVDTRILIEAATASARAVDSQLDATGKRVDSIYTEIQALAELHRELSRKMESLAAAQGSTMSEQLPLLRALHDRLESMAQITPVDTALLHNAAELSRDSEGVLDDAFYVALENRFRGTREAIRNRLAYYLPEIESARKRIDGLPQEPCDKPVPHPIFADGTFNVVDLGCGRGEWLRLLGESSVAAIGVDTNKQFLAECAKAGTQAIDADLFDYLASVPDECVGAVTCFHVIEHLGIAKIRELFHQTFRVLRRGGVAIFETPHAGNLVTSALNFHLDPTHVRPVHHLLARFIAESAGFASVRIEFLHPNEEARQALANADENVRAIGEFLFGPQDFGLIAVKP